MSTMILDECIVISVLDQKIVAPCQSDEDLDFVEYNTYANEDNPITIYNTRSEIPV
jgi:hypothetical protein